jgi:hypothetical protein
LAATTSSLPWSSRGARARWAEIVGLETEFARPGAVRVEWQLYELDTGELVRCPPKDDSYRTIDSMDWLSALVATHIART